MNPDTLMVAVPTRGQVEVATISRLNEIRDSAPGLPPIHFEEGHAGAGEVRNRIIAAFLATEHSALIMVDDDVFPPPQLLGLADLLEGGWDVAVHPTFIHRPGAGVTSNVYRRADGRLQPFVGSALSEADAVGAGCIAIHRRVVASIDPPWFCEMLGANGRLVLSDDIYFSQKVAVAGFKIVADFRHWADHRVRLGLAQFVRAK